jgi:Leucine-rich repeat (LRR) protein
LTHIKGLTNLTRLDLSGTQVSDQGLEHLTGLKNLQFLFLEGTRVTPKGITDLQKALPAAIIAVSRGG